MELFCIHRVYLQMKTIFLIPALFLFVTSVNADNQRLTAVSPEHRVSLLALYTSEGCSSCPPADKFLSNLQRAGVSNKQLIPLAFHVTYWDYIGWKDPYASPKHDDRQRKTAQFDQARTIYTPQFVLNGSDYRDYDNFSSNVRKVIQQVAKVGLTLNASHAKQQTNVELKTDLSQSDVDDVAYYIVVYENELVSDVQDGENEGETLSHNYVVRKIHGPFTQNKKEKTASFQQVIQLEKQWKKKDLGLVAYAQDSYTGKVLQVVELKLF